MEGNDNTPKAPAPVSVRLTRDAADALDALAAAAGGAIPRHRLIVAAVTHGARTLAADRVALLRLLVGDTLAAVAVEAPPAAAPLPSSPVARSNTAAPVTAARAASGDASDDNDALDGSGPYVSPDDLPRLRRALVAAAKQGASIAALADAAGINSGGSRRMLARVRDGEQPRVSRRVFGAALRAAEAWRP